MKSNSRPHHGRTVLSPRELARLQALWANIELPACAPVLGGDDEPRPTGPAAARPVTLFSRLWAEAA